MLQKYLTPAARLYLLMRQIPAKKNGCHICYRTLQSFISNQDYLGRLGADVLFSALESSSYRRKIAIFLLICGEFHEKLFSETTIPARIPYHRVKPKLSQMIRNGWTVLNFNAFWDSSSSPDHKRNTCIRSIATKETSG